MRKTTTVNTLLQQVTVLTTHVREQYPQDSADNQRISFLLESLSDTLVYFGTVTTHCLLNASETNSKTNQVGI